jgi:hypothetical protein
MSPASILVAQKESTLICPRFGTCRVLAAVVLAAGTSRSGPQQIQACTGTWYSSSDTVALSVTEKPSVLATTQLHFSL